MAIKATDVINRSSTLTADEEKIVTEIETHIDQIINDRLDRNHYKQSTTSILIDVSELNLSYLSKEMPMLPRVKDELIKRYEDAGWNIVYIYEFIPKHQEEYKGIDGDITMETIEEHYKHEFLFKAKSEQR